MLTDPLRMICACALAAMLMTNLGGCAMDSKTTALESSSFGEANRQTMAAQIIDPAPDYEYAVATTSADHAAQAVSRYRADKIKKPERVRTSNAGNVGGGAGASAGSGGQ